MNFLAHIYLSGNNDLLKIGNFMADGVHGKHLDIYHPEIVKGIILHRKIDVFTDSHPIFRQSTKRLHSNYHHYSGIIVDIFYDHFLAKNWSRYSNEQLENYIDDFYQSLQLNFDLLNEKTQKILPTLFRDNWFLSYQTIDGIATILEKMDYRINKGQVIGQAVQELRSSYSEFEAEFFLFFEELKLYTNQVSK